MSELNGITVNYNLSGYLNASGVVEGYTLQADLGNRGDLAIMMGQTFDDGQPLDLIKFGLLMADIQDVARQNQIDSTASWLIADHFISEINKDQPKSAVNMQGQDRLGYLDRINRAFGLNIGFVLSSQLSETPKYKQKLDQLTEESEKNPEFREAILLAVPEDRRADPASIRYPIEEIATITSLDTDIKIGPVYERKYDDPTRNIASRIGFKVFASIYGTRGYLFGSPVVDEDVRSSVEEFGILPYKINSKGQRSHRIDPINDQPDKVEKLIFDTDDPRAIMDLVAILSLASRRVQSDHLPPLELEKPASDITQVKKLAFNAYLCYIYNPLQAMDNGGS